MSKNKNPTDSKELDIQKKFEEEIQKPYYKVDYLDNFKLPYEKLDVSAVIPTYNRCPYKPNSLKKEFNPLAWAIQSLLLQKPLLNEIIVVDDCSEDYTKDVVESFKEEAKEKDIELRYVKNSKRSGYSRSINIGASLSNSKYLFFVDDDSIIAPYAAFGAVYSFEWLKKEDINVGIINLPPYARSSIPNGVAKQSEIGQLDFSKGIFTSGKNNFPEEFLEEGSRSKKFIHEDYHILKPIQIKNSGGYFLCSKDIFVKVGGFPETISERYMDTEFGSKVFENGYIIYLSADPKFHCVHGSYGLKSGKKFEGDDWFRKIGGMISLKKSMSQCDIPEENTGCRIDIQRVIYSSISAVFWMIYKRNAQGATRWMKKVYDQFVVNGDNSVLNISIKEIIPETERKNIWNQAIRNSINFIEKTEKQKIKNIRKIKKKFEEEKEISRDVLNKILDF